MCSVRGGIFALSRNSHTCSPRWRSRDRWNLSALQASFTLSLGPCWSNILLLKAEHLNLETDHQSESSLRAEETAVCFAAASLWGSNVKLGTVKRGPDSSAGRETESREAGEIMFWSHRELSE